MKRIRKKHPDAHNRTASRDHLRPREPSLHLFARAHLDLLPELLQLARQQLLVRGRQAHLHLQRRQRRRCRVRRVRAALRAELRRWRRALVLLVFILLLVIVILVVVCVLSFSYLWVQKRGGRN